MYLISNVLNVILGVWEFYDSVNYYSYGLMGTMPEEFQDYGSDVSNILVVLCRNLRLPVYLLCNAAIRAETLGTCKDCGASGTEENRSPSDIFLSEHVNGLRTTLLDDASGTRDTCVTCPTHNCDSNSGL